MPWLCYYFSCGFLRSLSDTSVGGARRWAEVESFEVPLIFTLLLNCFGFPRGVCWVKCYQSEKAFWKLSRKKSSNCVEAKSNVVKLINIRKKRDSLSPNPLKSSTVHCTKFDHKGKAANTSASMLIVSSNGVTRMTGINETSGKLDGAVWDYVTFCEFVKYLWRMIRKPPESLESHVRTWYECN